ASRDARQTRSARAPHRRGERAAGPAGRSGGAGGGPRTARARRRAGAAALRQRARHLPGPGERGGARRALARPPGVAVLSARRLLWAAVAAYAAAFATLSVLRDRAFQTGRFDLGNMVQAVWSTAHGHPLRITELGGDQISRLGAHVDPILAVFAPLWWIWPSPDVLLVVQALAIDAGAFPVYWLARRHLDSTRAGLGFALAYLLYPATGWLTLNEFHPVALATPLLLFAFWFLDTDRMLPFAVFAAAASLC